MEWHEMKINEFLAFKSILRDADIKDRIEQLESHIESDDIDEHHIRTLEQLVKGYKDFDEIRQRILDMDTPAMVLIRLPKGDNDVENS